LNCVVAAPDYKIKNKELLKVMKEIMERTKAERKAYREEMLAKMVANQAKADANHKKMKKT
jgi:hypothetical protein